MLINTWSYHYGSRFGESSSSRLLPDSSVPCPTGMFRCKDGKCITSLWVCNYQKDCDGGEDEQQSCPPPECEAGQISCGQYIFNKTYCIPPHYRCDMTDDCEDKSDEAQCTIIYSTTFIFAVLLFDNATIND
ncbi:low-density lipoprotein receptor-like [Teleopsis dalmanni]|uniref:low-density lipoprotein receptor-like n=1 Tax=Teleopsis dalmanni TaxID=139649 RepID=UPI0018CF613B|nr:low-density lipoprotein receptor-like [Teleopsis dalmanni]